MARAYVYDMVDTWNAGATTFTAIKMNVTDTASAAGSLLMDLRVGGSSKFKVDKSGRGELATDLWIKSDAVDRGLYFGSAADLLLARDAANTLAQRNGTNAQTFRLYDTYTDVSNYRRLAFSAGAIYAESAGSGGNFSAEFGTGSGNSGSTYLRTNNTRRWQVDGSGHFLAGTDNTYDIGASGANRPRAIYTAGLADIRGSLYVGGAVEFIGVSAGVVTLREFATSAFNRLQFGGTSSAFPALKRSSAEMHVRLADDSNYANLACLDLLSVANVRAQVNTAIPAGGTTGAGLRVSSTANFGVFFGSGAPTLSAAKGSLYLRSDGTTTNDRMYVNTDGATTWTAVTTAA